MIIFTSHGQARNLTKKCQFLVVDPKSPAHYTPKSCSLGVK